MHHFRYITFFLIMNQTDLLTSQKCNFIILSLNHGAEIWGYHKAPEVESILSEFVKNYSV